MQILPSRAMKAWPSLLTATDIVISVAGQDPVCLYQQHFCPLESSTETTLSIFSSPDSLQHLRSKEIFSSLSASMRDVPPETKPHRIPYALTVWTAPSNTQRPYRLLLPR